MQCSGVGRAAEQRVGMVTPSSLATVRAHYTDITCTCRLAKGFCSDGNNRCSQNPFHPGWSSPRLNLTQLAEEQPLTRLQPLRCHTPFLVQHELCVLHFTLYPRVVGPRLEDAVQWCGSCCRTTRWYGYSFVPCNRACTLHGYHMYLQIGKRVLQ